MTATLRTIPYRLDQVGGRSGRAFYQYTLSDSDLDELNSWTPQLLSELVTCVERADLDPAVHVMLLAGEQSIREVIPFPKTAKATDLMCEAPSPVPERQLRELGIRLAKP